MNSDIEKEGQNLVWQGLRNRNSCCPLPSHNASVIIVAERERERERERKLCPENEDPFGSVSSPISSHVAGDSLLTISEDTLSSLPFRSLPLSRTTLSPFFA